MDAILGIELVGVAMMNVGAGRLQTGLLKFEAVPGDVVNSTGCHQIRIFLKTSEQRFTAPHDCGLCGRGMRTVNLGKVGLGGEKRMS